MMVVETNTAPLPYDVNNTKMSNDSISDVENGQYETMCKQEQKYMGDDYLSSLSFVDQECRGKMIEWFYKIVDYCQLDREVVEIAVNYLDRFLSNNIMVQEDSFSRSGQFHVVAITCLYVAVKIHEPVVMEAPIVVRLSGGQVTEEELLNCEQQLLGGLSWRMNPPTSMTFLRYLVNSKIGRCEGNHYQDEEELGANEHTPSIREQVMNLSRIQLEAAVKDDTFVQHQVLPSVLARVAASNSLLFLGHDASQFLELESSDQDQPSWIAARLAKALPTPDVADTNASSSPASMKKQEQEEESTTDQYEEDVVDCRENEHLSSPKSVSSLSTWSIMTRILEQITA